LSSIECEQDPAAINMLSARRMTRCIRHDVCAEQSKVSGWQE
jgi:hypothetical protein